MWKVELFERIRREHYVEGTTIRALAYKYGVHRRMIRQALQSALPPPRKPAQRAKTVLTATLRGVIDQWLKADREAPRKQRHTARRVFQRLLSEQGYTGVESTVRHYVGERKRELALGVEVFVPQHHLPGKEAEADWWEARVHFPEGPLVVQFFSLRACASGREYVTAFLRATQQAFLEAHVEAFEHFGGVFEKIRYDNLPLAVKKVLRGRSRQETERFVALKSHFLFAAVFCRPGEEGAHEKGGVENSLGRYRRTHLVPEPKVRDVGELRTYLRARTAADDLRQIAGRAATVIQEWQAEVAHLRPLPAKSFEVAQVSTHRADAKSRVLAGMNFYSVPIRFAHRKVEVRLSAWRMEAWAGGQRVAEHERLYGRYQERLELDHYLELLMEKPGAFCGSRPLRQARENGSFPASYDRLWEVLKGRHGERDGTRQMVEVLLLHRQATQEEVRMAVELAVEYGCAEASAVAVLLRQLRAAEERLEALPVLGELSRYERPASRDLGMYDALLAAARTQAEVEA